VQRARVPPEEVSVIAVDDAVTVLPDASSIVITGWVVKSAPETPAAGCVVKMSFEATPVILKLALVVDESPGDDAVSVNPFPSALPPQPENEAEPPEAARGFDVHPFSEPLLIESVIDAVDVVTMLPKESSNVTTGSVAKGVVEGDEVAEPVG
jgi:hypothetical protein